MVHDTMSFHTPLPPPSCAACLLATHTCTMRTGLPCATCLRCVWLLSGYCVYGSTSESWAIWYHPVIIIIIIISLLLAHRCHALWFQSVLPTYASYLQSHLLLIVISLSLSLSNYILLSEQFSISQYLTTRGFHIPLNRELHALCQGQVRERNEVIEPQRETVSRCVCPVGLQDDLRLVMSSYLQPASVHERESERIRYGSISARPSPASVWLTYCCVVRTCLHAQWFH